MLLIRHPDALLSDFNREIAEYMSDMEFDGDTFVQTEERLKIIPRLQKRPEFLNDSFYIEAIGVHAAREYQLKVQTAPLSVF